MLVSKTYTVDGNTNNFGVPFDYIDDSYVKVKLNGQPLTKDIDYIFLTQGTVQLTTTPVSGDLVTVYRDTPKDKRLVDFQDGTLLDDGQLNLDGDQVFDVLQEYVDNIEASLQLDTDGKFDARNDVIKNVAAPEADYDAANKGYVDLKLAADVAAVKENRELSQQAVEDAAESASNAHTSEVNAAESASIAVSKADDAANSSMEAGRLASQATVSASNASSYANNAQISVSKASDSEVNAADSASQAAESAAAAANSASSAQESASIATEQANYATTSATNAHESELDAAESANQAAISANNAAISAASIDISGLLHTQESGLSPVGYTKSEADNAFAAISHNHDERYRLPKGIAFCMQAPATDQQSARYALKSNVTANYVNVITKTAPTAATTIIIYKNDAVELTSFSITTTNTTYTMTDTDLNAEDILYAMISGAANGIDIITIELKVVDRYA